jgi:hypothetical protein
MQKIHPINELTVPSHLISQTPSRSNLTDGVGRGDMGLKFLDSTLGLLAHPLLQYESFLIFNPKRKESM